MKDLDNKGLMHKTASLEFLWWRYNAIETQTSNMHNNFSLISFLILIHYNLRLLWLVKYFFSNYTLMAFHFFGSLLLLSECVHLNMFLFSFIFVSLPFAPLDFGLLSCFFFIILWVVSIYRICCGNYCCPLICINI